MTDTLLYGFEIQTCKDGDDHIEINLRSTGYQAFAAKDDCPSLAEAKAAAIWGTGILARVGMAMLDHVEIAGQNHGCERRYGPFGVVPDTGCSHGLPQHFAVDESDHPTRDSCCRLSMPCRECVMAPAAQITLDLAHDLYEWPWIAISVPVEQATETTDMVTRYLSAIGEADAV